MGRLVNAYRGTKKIKKCLINDKIIFGNRHEPITDGLVEWFDFADRKSTETTLKSRVSDNVLTLTNFNFDENSGWTGKALKFDGINDYIEMKNTLGYEFTISIDLELDKNTTRGYIVSSYVSEYNRLELVKGETKTTDGFNTVFFSGYSEIIDTDLSSNRSISLTKGKNEEVDFFVNSFKPNGSISALGFTTEKLRFFCFYNNTTRNLKGIAHSIKIYNRALTPEEIQQNYNYEQSIDRSTTMLLPEAPEEKSYMIGLSNQLSEEQLSTFRLSNNKEKFVCGLRYSENLIGELYTYSEIQKEMEKEEWCCQESIE
ncbi:MAG: hypothetical protein ACRCW9_03020 [Cetobacterium sp.]